MDTVKILSAEKIGRNYISKEYLPDGKDEYYIRNEQHPDSSSTYRHLTPAEIEQLEKNWLNNLSGGISGGYDFTKGNNQTNMNVRGNLDFKTPQRALLSQVSSTFSGHSTISSGIRPRPRHQTDGWTWGRRW